MPEFIALCTREAGKTIPDGVAEVREAVDFLRYYAGEARELFGARSAARPDRRIQRAAAARAAACSSASARGISRWRSSLGQVAAALAAGNSVIAKPAEQTNLIGYAAVKLLHEAGVPEARAAVPAGRRRHRRRRADRRSARGRRRLHRLHRHRPRHQPRAGRARCRDRRADRRDRRPERLDRRFLGVAGTAGQGRDGVGVHVRRPALLGRARAVRAGRHRRQGDRHAGRRDGRTEGRRSGPAVHRRRPGDRRRRAEAARGPRRDAWTSDAKPIAKARDRRSARARHVLRAAAPGNCSRWTSCTREIFGPVLHVIRWKGDQLDAVIDAINATGYGLTLGIHSRIDETIERIAARANVGNIYVNRNQIGAVVGVQPFGGQRPVRHRPQGRRPALPAALRHREDGDGQHHRGRRQCLAADAGRVIAGPVKPAVNPGRACARRR